MTGTFNAADIVFAPLIAPETLIGFGIISALFLLASFWTRRQIILPRLIMTALFFILLGNPSIVEEERDPLPDTALIVVDQSPSQSLGARDQITQDAIAHLQNEIGSIDNLNADILYSGSGRQEETRLLEDVRRALSDIPPNQRAGIIFITDGHIHDLNTQKALNDLSASGPVHTILTGRKNETDTRIHILESPAYGIVGGSVTARFQITQTGRKSQTSHEVTITSGGNLIGTYNVGSGEENSIELDITHPGQNIFEFSTTAAPNELTALNNKAIINVQGVRDRLKVLLVSGMPHMGGRMWRNLLKSDPAVDLVHFTILRQPDKRDNVPQRELSLIPFPFQELFEEKLYDFDLIIFDRYTLNRILPPHYFDNIRTYVEKGGALLEASGPEYATENSVFSTSLRSILPGRPDGRVLETAYKPALSKNGQTHPVSYILNKNNTATGPWLRQLALSPQNQKDKILMTGAENLPLLFIGTRSEGRIAQLASDQIWLWERGYEGGGPYRDLLRRLVHWLMKEPELEENKLALNASYDGIDIQLRHEELTETETANIFVEGPDGNITNIRLERDEQDGFLTAKIPASLPGLYTARYKNLSTVTSFGALQSLEFQNVVTSEETLKPFAQETGGHILWAGESSAPSVRHQEKGRRMGGTNWIGLQKNNSYNVARLQASPLLPPSAMLALAIMICLISWRFESRS